MVRTVALIQARMGSTRFPGKVLTSLRGQSILFWVISRLRAAETLDAVVVATSTAEADDLIEARCEAWGVPTFRGSEQDVLSRFLEGARVYSADLIVRVNADNPLVDPRYVDLLVHDARQAPADYVSFQLSSGKPVMKTGVSFFAEALTRDCLERAAEKCTDASEREHVTIGIYQRPDEFDVRFLRVPDVCDDEDLRFTLDTSEDHAILDELLAMIGERALESECIEIVELARRTPGLVARMRDINRRHPKNAAYAYPL